MSLLFDGAPLLKESARSFQVEDAQYAASKRGVVLGHKTGLGKTFISLLAWSHWPNATRGLVVGTVSSTSVWRGLLKRWVGVEATILQGGSDPAWENIYNKKQAGVWLCTYASLRLRMSKVESRRLHVNVLVNDELHRAMRSRKTQIYKAMREIDFDHYLGLSATWASRGPQDLWPVLHLIDRKVFPSFWSFVDRWCFVEKTTFGTEIFGVRDAPQLRQLLRSKYYCARTHKDVASQFLTASEGDPVIRRQILLSMSPGQQRLYETLDREMIAELTESREVDEVVETDEDEDEVRSSDMIVAPTVLAKLTRLLQIAICPRILLEKAELGTAIEWLVDQVAEEPHTVIFSPFRDALDCVRTSLIADGIVEEQIFILRGGMTANAVDVAVEGWKRVKGVMLCTVSFAQSFSLDTVNIAHMLGFDWDPDHNIQAEGRLRRLDSELQSPCIVNYIVMEGTVYEQVREVVNGKVANVRQFLEGYSGGRKG